jgi:hypothetical protein
MTESEWLSSTDAEAMLRFLQLVARSGESIFDPKRSALLAVPPSDRKLRLFSCAWCRWLWPKLSERSRQAVEVAEQFADGRISREKLDLARAAIGEPLRVHRWGREDGCPYCAALPNAVLAAAGPTRWRRRPGEADVQLTQLRDIFGNPFRPLPARRFPTHVVGVAQACYDAFPAVGMEFAVLADALEELGEAEAAAHCREKDHAKGCHILDWVLGKS